MIFGIKEKSIIFTHEQVIFDSYLTTFLGKLVIKKQQHIFHILSQLFSVWFVFIVVLRAF